MERGLSGTVGENAQLTLRFNSSQKWPWTSLSQEPSKTNFSFHWEKCKNHLPQVKLPAVSP